MSWIEKFHDSLLAEMLLVRNNPAQLSKDISFLIKVLQLEKTGPILDQCCGIGSISIPMAQQGYSMVGVDIIPAYIQRAQKESSLLNIQFHCADACSFVHQNCQAAFNWWTGFGYCATDKEDKRMIEMAYQSLRKGGCYVLDTMNPAGVMRNFKPTMQTTRSSPNGDLHLIRHTEINWYTGRMEKEWTYYLNGKQQVQHHSSVRIYQPHEIVSMFQEVGFTDIQLYGNTKQEALSMEHFRCICVGRKN